jgi:hypothetical protein
MPSAGLAGWAVTSSIRLVSGGRADHRRVARLRRDHKGEGEKASDEDSGTQARRLDDDPVHKSVHKPVSPLESDSEGQVHRS